MSVGNSLLENGHIQPVGLRSRNSIKQGHADFAFCAGANALYRFVSIL